MNKTSKIFSILAFLFLVFPVQAGLITIDQDVQDTWWRDGQGLPNGDRPYGKVELRTNRVDKYNQRIGVQFNDLSILQDLDIISAEFQLYRFSGANYREATYTSLQLHSISQQWQESSSLPLFERGYIDEVTIDSRMSRNLYLSWDITELLNAWLQDEVINNGVLLQGVGNAHFQRFYSSEKAGFGPRLVINTADVSEPKTIFILILALVLLCCNHVFAHFKSFKVIIRNYVAPLLNSKP